IFVLLYLGLTFLTRRERLTSTEYQLNALSQLEEAVLREMDEHEKQAVAELLRRANPRSAITKQLQTFLHNVDANKPDTLSRQQRIYTAFSKWYERMWSGRSSNALVRAFFVIEIALFVLAVV